MTDRYRPFFSDSEFARLLAELDKPLPPAIRLNTLKTKFTGRINNAGLQTSAKEYGWQLESVFFCDSGYQILQSETPPARTLEYKMGDFYIQDAASMLPVEMFTPAESPLILDMAAAPGGKTTHLVSKFADTTSIIANDSSANRLAAVKANLQTWGAMGVRVTNFNGEQFGAWYPNTFDKILLDAPCSGDTLRPHKGSKQREVSTSEQDRLQQRQIALLTAAFHALKPQGEMVYSTCTLSPDENEAVLDALLREFPNFLAVEAVTHLPFGDSACGLTHDGDHPFDPQIQNAIRLWPHLYHTSGFFAARLKKLDSVDFPHAQPPTQPSKRLPLSDKRTNQMLTTLREFYDFDFAPIIARQNLIFEQHEDYIYALPATLSEKFPDLPYVVLGFLVGQFVDGDFVPSHELVTRFDFSQPRYRVSDEQKKIWLAGRELRDLPIPTPYILLEDEQGRFLGRGKIAGNRVRNLLPKRLIG